VDQAEEQDSAGGSPAKPSRRRRLLQGLGATLLTAVVSSSVPVAISHLDVLDSPDLCGEEGSSTVIKSSIAISVDGKSVHPKKPADPNKPLYAHLPDFGGCHALLAMQPPRGRFQIHNECLITPKDDRGAECGIEAAKLLHSTKKQNYFDYVVAVIVVGDAGFEKLQNDGYLDPYRSDKKFLRKDLKPLLGKQLSAYYSSKSTIPVFCSD
jgi:hypothetical protein